MILYASIVPQNATIAPQCGIDRISKALNKNAHGGMVPQSQCGIHRDFPVASACRWRRVVIAFP